MQQILLLNSFFITRDIRNQTFLTRLHGIDSNPTRPESIFWKSWSDPSRKILTRAHLYAARYVLYCLS